MASSNVDTVPGARPLPIGTERRRASEKAKGMVSIKVGDHGKRSEQWRPKHHAVWERANGRPVPAGFCVIFKDGNKENFDPANLELNTPAEVFARSMARFRANPPALRRVIRLNRKLERELRRQMKNCSAPPDTGTAIRGRKSSAVQLGQADRMPATCSRK